MANFDFFKQNPHLWSGLLGLSQGLAQAGAPSPYPQSFIGGIGQAGAGFAGGVEHSRAQEQQRQYDQQRLELARQQAEMQKAEADRQAAADAQWQGLFGTQPQQAQGPARPDQPMGYQTATGQQPSPFGNLTPQQRALLMFAGRDKGISLLPDMLKPAEAKLPTSIQEYQYGLQDPAYNQWVLDQKRAGANSTSVNVNTPKSILAGDNKMLEIGAEGFAQAQEILPLFGIAKQAAQSFGQSGPLGGAALFTERAKNYMGLDNNASAGEVLQGMQTRLGTLLRVPGSGATSNMEMSLYMQGVPGLLNSQQGNIALATIGEKLTKKRMADYQRLQAYVQQNQTSVGYQPDETPVLTPEEMQMLQGASGQPAQTEIPTVSTPEEAAQLPKGTKFRDPNGVIRVVP